MGQDLTCDLANEIMLYVDVLELHRLRGVSLQFQQFIDVYRRVDKGNDNIKQETMLARSSIRYDTVEDFMHYGLVDLKLRVRHKISRGLSVDEVHPLEVRDIELVVFYDCSHLFTSFSRKEDRYDYKKLLQLYLNTKKYKKEICDIIIKSFIRSDSVSLFTYPRHIILQVLERSKNFNDLPYQRWYKELKTRPIEETEIFITCLWEMYSSRSKPFISSVAHELPKTLIVKLEGFFTPKDLISMMLTFNLDTCKFVIDYFGEYSIHIYDVLRKLIDSYPTSNYLEELWEDLCDRSDDNTLSNVFYYVVDQRNEKALEFLYKQTEYDYEEMDVSKNRLTKLIEEKQWSIIKLLVDSKAKLDYKLLN
jgi:hypothetical protein